MSLQKYKGKYAGWGKKYTKGKPTVPFTRKEFNKSIIKNKMTPNYESYISDWDSIKYKPRKVNRRPRQDQGFGLFSSNDIGFGGSASNIGSFDLGFDMPKQRSNKDIYKERVQQAKSRLNEKLYGIKLKELEAKERNLARAEREEQIQNIRNKIGSARKGFGNIKSKIKSFSGSFRKKKSIYD
jgi:hypothetical protein